MLKRGWARGGPRSGWAVGFNTVRMVVILEAKTRV